MKRKILSWKEQISTLGGKVLTPVYLGGATLHQWLYEVEILKKQKVSIPVISIGSVLSGGAGKTPFVIWLARLLNSRGMKVAILSRGYGRKTKGYFHVQETSQVCQSGDEPLMMARALPECAVLVGSDRPALATIAKQDIRADLCLLDDGMQHRRLKKDMEIALIDSTRPFGSGWLRRRDPLSRLQQCRLLVFTRVNQVEEKELSFLKETFRGLAPHALSICARYEISSIPSFDPLFAFAGIANPKSFALALKDKGVKLMGAKWFSDHHEYSMQDMEIISKLAKKAGAKGLVTTQKDAVKLGLVEGFHLPLIVVNLDIGIDLEDTELVYKEILKCAGNMISGFSSSV